MGLVELEDLSSGLFLVNKLFDCRKKSHHLARHETGNAIEVFSIP